MCNRTEADADAMVVIDHRGEGAMVILAMMLNRDS